jgi:hypothetical protein
MSSEALLAIVAVLLALFAIIPQERASELRLRLKQFDIGILIASVEFLHLIKFYRREHLLLHFHGDDGTRRSVQGLHQCRSSR